MSVHPVAVLQIDISTNGLERKEISEPIACFVLHNGLERREYIGIWSDKLTQTVLKEGKCYAIDVRLLKAIITGRPMVLKELNTHRKAPKWS